ncbi:MAG TPA: hypothetical protein PLQ01_04630 [Methanothrix sp.]|nr:hypothetical protein [Methanothrix sp.]
MAKRPEERTFRESDNPIVEEFKDELLSKSSLGIRPAPDDDARLRRLEGLLAEVKQKVEELEKRVMAVEGRR